jgi:hypothetical protein
MNGKIGPRNNSPDTATSTTIARIPHGKGEHRIRPCHDQSQISARLDGSPIVDPYFRPQWLPNFSNIQAHCGIRPAKTWNEIMPCVRSWLQCVSRLRSFHCHQVRSKRERHLPLAARFAGNIGPRIAIRQTLLLDHMVALNESHLKRLLLEYVRYHHEKGRRLCWLAPQMTITMPNSPSELRQPLPWSRLPVCRKF